MEAILQQLYERKAKLERELGGVTLAITALEEAFDLQPLNLPSSFSGRRKLASPKEGSTNAISD